MTERNPPSWTQNGAHPAAHDRLLTESLVAAEGVITAGALAVSQRAAGANMSVDVAAGHGWVEGDQDVHQGIYHVYNDAVVNLAIAASDPSNPRVDLVIARVYDSFYAGSVDEFALEVVTGSPAASPSEPAVPENSLVLARVDVGAGVTSITDADITDRRPRTYPRGGGHVGTVVFDADGTFSKADYPWLSRVRVRLVGGGGAGGSSGDGGNSGGGGGGGGGYAESILDVDDLAASETVTVGAAGLNGGIPNQDGNAGGASSFGAHAAANGGFGGIANGGHGGAGGSGTAGQVQMSGGGGDPGPAGVALGGSGGDSMLGGGANGGEGSRSGNHAGNYGGGGSGGCRVASGGVRGGNGGPGVVIVELFA